MASEGAAGCSAGHATPGDRSASDGLAIEGLAVTRGGRCVVEDMNLTARRGEITGLLGPNGAGKSTTLGAIIGYYPMVAGSITVDGKPLRRGGPRIGFAPQDIALYPSLTARENLVVYARYAGVPRREVGGAVRAALGAAQLTEDARRRVSTFSGGMKRRLSLAVATLGEPDVVMLDEPTVGVDPQARAHLLGAVRDIAAIGAAVVYSSHYMEEVEALCPRVAVIDHGRTIASGTVDELRGMGSPSVVARTDPEMVPALRQVGLEVIELDDGRIMIVTPRPTETLAKVATAMTRVGHELSEVQVGQRNLEAAFFALTGRDLRS